MLKCVPYPLHHILWHHSANCLLCVVLTAGLPRHRRTVYKKTAPPSGVGVGRLTSLARAAFRAVPAREGWVLAIPSVWTGRGISLMDLVGYLVRGQMCSGDGFISTSREHFGLWTVTKFGVTRRLTVSVVIQGRFAMMIRSDSHTAKALAMYTPTLYHTRYVHMDLFWP